MLEAALDPLTLDSAAAVVLLALADDDVLVGTETPGQFRMHVFIVLYASEPPVKSLGKDAIAQARAQLYASQGRSSAGQRGAPLSSSS